MTDITIVEIFGIKMENRYASLLRVVCDKEVHWDLRMQACGKLCKAGATSALEYIVRDKSLHWDLRQKAMDHL